MARRKDIDWGIPDNVNSWEGAQLSVLMDIRDELKVLNTRFRCPDFLAIPRVLREIKANTSKPRKAKLRRVA